MSKILEKPSKKLFLIDLCQCRESVDPASPGGEETAPSKIWHANCAGINVTFSMVAVQGLIVQIQDNGNTLFLDDGTAVAMVKGCNKLPFQCSKLFKGYYIMVVGQLLQTGKSPVIRAIKIQNLSHNIAMTTIWSLEVIDELQQNVAVT